MKNSQIRGGEAKTEEIVDRERGKKYISQFHYKISRVYRTFGMTIRPDIGISGIECQV